MRVGHETSDYNCISYKLPNRFIDRLRFNEEVSFEYINADDRFCDYQGDEFGTSYGMYEVSIETPAVPAGTYEIRVGLLLNGKRGVAQYYWDGVPCGLPLDLDVSSTDPSIGYVTPGTDKTDPYGYENDKVLRNHGFMKAPATFKAVSGFWQPNGAYTSARNNYNALRRNLIVITFITAETHRLQIKAVRAGEVMLDYIEFVPVTVLDKEDIY